ncbi:MAG TPA: NAD-dependent epimerase/dehydratase family protein [Pirellulales bacterium]
MVRSASTILVTGAGGMLGRAVCAALRRETRSPGPLGGATIVGWGRRPLPQLSGDPAAVVPVPELENLDAYTACDVGDAGAVNQTLAAIAPDLVFHVAALNAFAAPDDLERVNVGGLAKILDGLHHVGRCVRVVVVGSAAELGSEGAKVSPITEEAICRPESAYGKTKHRATQLALALPPGGCVDAVIARPFNLVGVGLDQRLALASFARQIAAVSRGERTSVGCGPLHTKRDYLDADDAAAALVELALHGQAGEIYNVCSGVGRSMGELLHALAALAGVSPILECDVSIPPGPLEVVGDPAKLMRTTSWRPATPIESTLARLLAAAGVAAPLGERQAA